MSQAYSRPSRESDPYALPDIETFQADYSDCPHCGSTVVSDGCGEYRCDNCRDGRAGFTPAKEDIREGWFYWFSFPGCMPDSDPMGPYDSEEDALADAREGTEDESEDEVSE